MRVLVLALLALAPPLAGAVHEPVFVPLLAGAALAGLVTLVARRGEPLPGRRRPPAPRPDRARARSSSCPLPPALLRVLSPGSYAFHDAQLLVPPLAAWKPISVSPRDTLRGLAFLAAFSLLALAVFRELAEGRGAGVARAHGRLHRARDQRGRAAAGGLARAEEALRRLAAALGLGRLRPLREPQPLRQLPGAGRARSRVGLALESLVRLRAAWATRRRALLLWARRRAWPWRGPPRW